VQSIQQANAFLPRYLAGHTRRIAHDHAALPNVHRTLPIRAAFELYCYAEFTRKVANDWTVRFAGITYQLLSPHSFCPAKATVIVRHTFNAHTLLSAPAFNQSNHHNNQGKPT
jgi:hypothetical protein